MSSATSPPPSAAAGDGAARGAAEAHHHHLPAGAHVGDRRGLTATGAVTVALVLGTLGAVVDVLSGPGLRTVFAVLFISGCAIAAFTVHREDLVAAVVMPPLVYCVVAFAGAVLQTTDAAGGFVQRNAFELATSLVLGAPVLLTAVGAALVVALVRGVKGRRV